jgi:transglutaminase-like putative cysteine protease
MGVYRAITFLAASSRVNSAVEPWKTCHTSAYAKIMAQVTKMHEYLRSTDVIDWEHAAVSERDRLLRGHATAPAEIARACFDWVRDEIKHSGDYALQAVTCRASEVLLEGSGYCYAKSHLLAALLRANGLQAGLCYQRLGIDDVGSQYCLHGFDAVRLPGHGWYRMDARGNKAGVDAKFEPPREHLAFNATNRGEATLPEIWADPLPVVVNALRRYSDARILGNNLPDIELWVA